MHGESILHAFPYINILKFFENFFFKFRNFIFESNHHAEKSLGIKASLKELSKKFLKIFLKTISVPIPLKKRCFKTGKQTNSKFVPGKQTNEAENQKSASYKFSAGIIPFRKYIHVGVGEQLFMTNNSRFSAVSKYS